MYYFTNNLLYQSFGFFSIKKTDTLPYLRGFSSFFRPLI
ncbi:hypothetical protein CHK_2208 [Christensenella hongkongensis]|uniref:Uncharacterized protein n=1 Tax=Christensenella hongkongensis TaxID=270498 RepID=A0A0M2NIR4_9FIRM|nr:hypothetical protein CHK_2208 [Christensenella hongkongensis]